MGLVLAPASMNGVRSILGMGWRLIMSLECSLSTFFIHLVIIAMLARDA